MKQCHFSSFRLSHFLSLSLSLFCILIYLTVMETSISSLQLGHLLIEGAVIAVSTELVIRCIFTSTKQRSWLIRCLKIIMASAMIMKSSIFSAFSARVFGGDSCMLAGRLADTFFHISSLAGLYVMLSRAMILIPEKYKTVFMVFHGCLLTIRLALGAADAIFAHIWVDQTTGVCISKDSNNAGIAYTIVDCFIDLYVSVVITLVLSKHIRNLKAMGVKGNSSLYISVVATNVFRTLTLLILNLWCTVYFFVSNDSVVMVLIIWPINNLLFIVLIGYDTNITKSVSNLQAFLNRARQQQYKLRSQNSGKFESSTYKANSLSRPFYDTSVRDPKSLSNSRSQSSAIIEVGDYESVMKLPDMKDIAPSSNASTLRCESHLADC